MKPITNIKIKDILIVVLIVIILLQKSCCGTNTPIETKVVTKTEIKYDTITNEIVSYVPKQVTRIVRDIDTLLKVDSIYITKYDTIFGDVVIDTAKILEDYFALYVYSDSQDLDSVKFVINDTISQNKIVSRGVEYTFIRPTIRITEKHFISKREFFMGIGLGGNHQRLSYIGTQFNYKDKRRGLYGVGIGIDSDLQFVISGQILWKIGKRYG